MYLKSINLSQENKCIQIYSKLISDGQKTTPAIWHHGRVGWRGLSHNLAGWWRGWWWGWWQCWWQCRCRWWCRWRCSWQCWWESRIFHCESANEAFPSFTFSWLVVLSVLSHLTSSFSVGCSTSTSSSPGSSSASSYCPSSSVATGRKQGWSFINLFNNTFLKILVLICV